MSAIHQSAPLDLSPTINTRLLKLELDSSEVTPSSAISVRLHVTSLVDAPPYTAVSYVWGEPSPTKQILLDGEAFTIRENLWNLLNRLRSERHQGYLWIDALSIDQTNNLEKNHQVAIMGSIYRQARTTIAWLGSATMDVAEGWKILESQSSHMSISLEALHDNPGWRFIWANPYWTRIWILQEYLLSADVEFWCSSGTMKANVLRWHMYQYYLPPGGTAAWNIMKLGSNSFNLENRSMMGLLRAAYGCQCVDAHDRIYALLSLLPPDEREAWSISPDYSKSMQALFEELVSAYPKSLRTLPLGDWKQELRRLVLREGMWSEEYLQSLV